LSAFSLCSIRGGGCSPSDLGRRSIRLRSKKSSGFRTGLKAGGAARDSRADRPKLRAGGKTLEPVRQARGAGTLWRTPRSEISEAPLFSRDVCCIGSLSLVPSRREKTLWSHQGYSPLSRSTKCKRARIRVHHHPTRWGIKQRAGAGARGPAALRSPSGDSGLAHTSAPAPASPIHIQKRLGFIRSRPGSEWVSRTQLSVRTDAGLFNPKSASHLAHDLLGPNYENGDNDRCYGDDECHFHNVAHVR
jgi:hypothetical protein